MLRYFFSNDEVTAIDPLIDDVLSEMKTIGTASSEYAERLSYLERLHELKAKDRRAPISRDTMAMIAANLAGILIIVAYERTNVITSKALNQIPGFRGPK